MSRSPRDGFRWSEPLIIIGSWFGANALEWSEMNILRAEPEGLCCWQMQALQGAG